MLFYGNEQIYGIDKYKSWTIKSLLGNFYVIFVCVGSIWLWIGVTLYGASVELESVSFY